jgi:hypothetical protein
LEVSEERKMLVLKWFGAFDLKRVASGKFEMHHHHLHHHRGSY